MAGMAICIHMVVVECFSYCWWTFTHVKWILYIYYSLFSITGKTHNSIVNLHAYSYINNFDFKKFTAFYFGSSSNIFCQVISKWYFWCRIDLGPNVVGQTEEAIRKASEHSSTVKQLTPYAIQQKKIRAHTSGAKPRDNSDFEMLDKDEEEKKKQEKAPRPRRKRVKVKKGKVVSDETPKPILRQKDTPPTGSRVVIKEDEPKAQTSQANRETPGMTLPTPLRGDASSPLKPYKYVLNNQ